MIARTIAASLVLALNAASPAWAAKAFDPFTTAAVEDRLGAPVPKDLALRDESGAEVTLGDFLGERPLLLAPVDLHCKNICGVTLAGVFEALETLDRKPGEAFELLVVSIDPNAEPAAAAAAKADYRARFATADAAHFLTGDAGRLLDAIGFHYAYDPATDQYAHPAVVAMLTPDGQLARWSYGYPFKTFDLRLALVEAGEGTIGTLSDRLWLLCYGYDPKTGTYTAGVDLALKAGGGFTILLLGGVVAVLLRRERHRTGGRP